MKSTTLILGLLLGTQIISGQNARIKDSFSQVITDKNMLDTFTFDLKWRYPWYISLDEKGNFHSALDDTLHSKDTIHLYYTANCVTNHQGEHRINYCMANLLNDTIQLTFMPEMPAYASTFTILIKNDYFISKFHSVYPVILPGEKYNWTVKKQKLILNDTYFKIGDIIKGYIELNFTETYNSSNKKTISNDFYFKGYFKVQLNKS